MNGYHPSHPWYYVLGGPVFRPRAVKALVGITKYGGYRADEIACANRLAEPQRSRRLATIKAEVLADLKRDLSRYRHLACRLRARQINEGVPSHPTCADNLDTALSLKFAHVYNGYAHLVALEGLYDQQQLAWDF
jgi:hypothetical protein